MFEVGHVVREVDDALRSYGDSRDLRSIYRAINNTLLDFAARYPFPCWTANASLDFSTGVDDDGALFLPGDCARVVGVWRVSDGVEFHGPVTRPRGAGDRRDGSPEPRFKWYHETPTLTPLLTSTSAEPATDQTTFVCGSTWNDNYVGEWVKFAATHGFMQLIDEWELDRPFQGDNVGGSVRMLIRPPGTKRMVILDYDDTLEPSVVDVTYQRYPDHVCREHHMIPLDSTRALKLAVLVTVMGDSDRRRLSRRDWAAEADDAFAELCASMPANIPERPAAGAFGSEVRWTAPWV